MEERSGVLLKFLLPSGCDELSVTQALHEAWERCSEAGLSLSWMEEETVLKLKSPVSEKVNKSSRHFTSVLKPLDCRWFLLLTPSLEMALNISPP